MNTTTRRTTTVRTARLPSARETDGVVVTPLSDPTANTAWASFVDRCRDASVFHRPEWSAAVHAAFGHRPLHLLATRGRQTVGLLPLVEVDSFLAGRLHVSVPYGTYGGILADDDAARAALASAAADQACQRKARVLDLRSATASITHHDYQPVDGYLGFARDLPLHPNDVPGFFPKRPRAAARHARDRFGVTVRHDNTQLKLVWQLYCRSMRRIASINYPLRFFRELRDRFGERAWVTVAWQDDRPICGTLSLVCRDTIMPYILGADERVRCDGAANLLYWSVMERAVRSGLHRFDYGRSRADNRGAIGFKKNQGFTPQPLGYQRYVPPGRQPPDLKPSNPRFALARRAWTHLPLPASRLLGSWLARAIPG